MREAAQAQLSLVHRLVDERIRFAEKLDVLARSLPDGVWLTSLVFESIPPDMQGKDQYRARLRWAWGGITSPPSSGRNLNWMWNRHQKTPPRADVITLLSHDLGSDIPRQDQRHVGSPLRQLAGIEDRKT